MEKGYAVFISGDSASCRHCQEETGISLRRVNKNFKIQNVFSLKDNPLCCFIDFADCNQIELMNIVDHLGHYSSVPVILYVNGKFCSVRNMSQGFSWYKGRVGWNTIASSVIGKPSLASVPKSNSWRLDFESKLELAACGNENVLILGPSGAGKTWTAEEIHKKSSRKNSTFVNASAAEFNSGLIESQLFGSVKGAYTGACGTKGLFEEADGGTLLIDEVAELPYTLQSKLLRVIERRTYCKVGSTKEIPFDCKLIFATNADIKTLVAKKKFRQDLYYRISQLKIELPSLSSHKEDVGHLAREFALCCGVSCSEAAQEKLEHRTWPGNVRQLRNTVELASTSCKVHGRTEILPEDILFVD